MHRSVAPALLAAMVSLAHPAVAQNEPFRVLNRAALPAVALHVARSGQAVWSDNLLNQGPLRPGSAFSLRPGEGMGCRLNLRLVLTDGTEVVRRDADICAERVIEVGGGNERR